MRAERTILRVMLDAPRQFASGNPPLLSLGTRMHRLVPSAPVPSKKAHHIPLLRPAAIAANRLQATLIRSAYGTRFAKTT